MGALPDTTAIGAVELIVRDLDRSVSFYERAIGLEVLERDPVGHAALGAGGRRLLVLHGEPEAPPRPPRTTGLFHFAILVPDRPGLARSLARLVDAGWRLTGASDHLVSEALYLDDPEGIGIEIYRDRPREEWPYDGGSVRMATLPLDLDGLMGELGDGPGEPLPAGTRIGHVHLNVADIGDSERFCFIGRQTIRWLGNFQLVEHRGEELAVFGDLDFLRRRADDVDAVLLEAERQVQRRLPAELGDGPPALLPLVDVQHVFQRERLEEKLVAGVVVR